MDDIFKMKRKTLIEFVYNTKYTRLSSYKSISTKTLIELYIKKLNEKNQYHKQEFII